MTGRVPRIFQDRCPSVYSIGDGSLYDRAKTVKEPAVHSTRGTRRAPIAHAATSLLGTVAGCSPGAPASAPSEAAARTIAAEPPQRAGTAVDTAGNVYLGDDLNFRVPRLPVR